MLPSHVSSATVFAVHCRWLDVWAVLLFSLFTVADLTCEQCYCFRCSLSLTSHVSSATVFAVHCRRLEGVPPGRAISGRLRVGPRPPGVSVSDSVCGCRSAWTAASHCGADAPWCTLWPSAESGLCTTTC